MRAASKFRRPILKTYIYSTYQTGIVRIIQPVSLLQTGLKIICKEVATTFYHPHTNFLGKKTHSQGHEVPFFYIGEKGR